MIEEGVVVEDLAESPNTPDYRVFASSPTNEDKELRVSTFLFSIVDTSIERIRLANEIGMKEDEIALNLMGRASNGIISLYVDQRKSAYFTAVRLAKCSLKGELSLTPQDSVVISSNLTKYTLPCLIGSRLVINTQTFQKLPARHSFIARCGLLMVSGA